MTVARPTYSPTVNDFFPIQVSVSTEASAQAAGVGPFRGVFALVSTSLTITDIVDGDRMAVDNLAKNTTLWIQGYASAINVSAATATSTNSGDAAILFGVL